MDHSPLRRGPVPWRERLFAVILAATVAFAGCRSGAGNRPFAAYRQCLEKHGVSVTRPKPGPGPGSTNPEGTRPSNSSAFAEARRACKALRPAGGLRGGGIKSKPRAAFRRCMTDHGVTLPGPGARGTGPGATSTTTGSRGGMLNGLDRNDPAVAKALSACRSLLVGPSASTSTRP